MLSAVGYFSLFPLLFHVDLLIIRYSLYLAYMCFMYVAYVRFYKDYPKMNILEDMYIYGLMLIPIYEHIIGPWTGLNARLPFIPLLLYSTYCGIGVLYCFIRYYIHALEFKLETTMTTTSAKAKHKTKISKESDRNILSSASKAFKTDEPLVKTKVKQEKKKSKAN